MTSSPPLGIHSPVADASVSPHEHMALEAGDLARRVALLLGRVDATPTLRTGPERARLAGVLAELRDLARDAP